MNASGGMGNEDSGPQQFRKYEDDAFRLRLAKEIVAGKISNSLHTVRMFFYNHPDIDLKADTTALNTKLAGIKSADRIDQLLGIEGDAAKTYYNAFGKMLLGEEFSFSGRKKRPPTDSPSGS